MAHGQASGKRGRLIVLPLALYLFLSVLYLLAIPVGESPDEPGHLQCIEQVALYQRLPLTEPAPAGDTWWSRGQILSGRMCYHMPLYYLVAGTILQSTAVISGTNVPFQFPPTNEDFGAEAALFIHDEPSLWQLPEPATLISLRLLSLLLGLVTVVGSFALGLRLMPQEPAIAVLAGVLAAGWPQLAFMSRAISNDALATALAVITLLLLTRVGRPKRYIALAVISALALLAKITVAFGIVVIIIAWIIEFAAYKEERADYIRAILVSAVMWLATAALLFFQPVLREHLTISSSSFSGMSTAARTAAYWKDFFVLTLSSGWARLGWMNLPAPLIHAYIWWAFFALAAAAGLFLFWRNSTTINQRILLWICIIWITAVVLSYLRININRLQPQFRFMLAAVPVLTSWAATGILYGVRKELKLQWALVGGIAAFLVGYNLWFVLTIVQQAYQA
ncbi:MAG: hypothetical protein ACK2UJ_18685 [Candidatus Promineifilaceae bacterium]|jgi:hypothetical protein